MTTMQEVLDFLDNAARGLASMRNTRDPGVRKLGREAGQMFWKAKRLLVQALETPIELADVMDDLADKGLVTRETVPPDDPPKPKNGRRRPKI